MSEKKDKKKRSTVMVPKYDLSQQTQFIYSLCEEMKFKYQDLLTLIFADWICNFQYVSSVNGPAQAFVSYLQTAKKTAEKLKELRKCLDQNNQE